ncbi:MAG: phytanoyl-CoA dioxygenase family protein [Gemmatimonadota bacterium]|nr:phytanoyl-CoA dioxygenase family protein [Gemmatimonadota bacterium]
MSSPIQSGEPFGEETTREIIDRFHRDGFAHIPGVLEAGEMQALRDRTDALLDDMQSQYAVDWAFRRFGWMNRVPIPEDARVSASDRLLQLLGGRHPEGG